MDLSGIGLTALSVPLSYSLILARNRLCQLELLLDKWRDLRKRKPQLMIDREKRKCKLLLKRTNGNAKFTV